MYKINTCGVQNGTTIASHQQDQGKQGDLWELHLETLNTVIKAGAWVGWSHCDAVWVGWEVAMDRGSGVERLAEECVRARKLSTCWETVPLKSSSKQTCVLMVSLLSTVYLHVYAIINDSSTVLSYMDTRLNLHCNILYIFWHFSHQLTVTSDKKHRERETVWPQATKVFIWNSTRDVN